MTILKKKKCKKAKWLSAEALQIAEKRREAKGKGKRGRYTHLNVEFQRIERRGKKAFLGEEEVARINKNSTKSVLMTQITTVVWSLT